MVDVEYQKEIKNLYFKERDEEVYPVRRADKIEPGKVYRSRNGERIKIYAIEGKEVHGAILHDSKWHIDTWSAGGSYLAGKGKEHARDIILAPPLHIKLNQKYKSRDGRPVSIYAINVGSTDFPILGAIRDENNHMLPRVWNDKGVTKTPYGPNNDIVVEWSET